MTDFYTAPTNGHVIRPTDQGGLRINMSGMDYVDGHEPQTLVTGRVVSLREYFRDERDRELGRWRSKKDPDYVAYPSEDTLNLAIVDERDGLKQYTTRDSTGGALERFERVSEEYFAAHPVKKPWHDAKEGEVWLITLKQGTYPAIFQADAFTDIGGRWSPEQVIEARRIWPESKES